MLDERARAELLAAHPCRLTFTSQELCWQKQERVHSESDVRRIIEFCVGTAERLGSLSAEFQDREMSRALASGGYRGPSPDALRAAATSAREAGKAEVEELVAVRERRRQCLNIRARRSRELLSHRNDARARQDSNLRPAA